MDGLNVTFGEIHVGTVGLEDCNITCAKLFHGAMSSEYGLYILASI